MLMMAIAASKAAASLSPSWNRHASRAPIVWNLKNFVKTARRSIGVLTCGNPWIIWRFKKA